MGRKSRSRSSSSGRKEKEKEKKKDKEKKEKDRGSKRSRSGRGKDKEKERRFKEGQSDKVKEKEKEKEKDRDRDKDKDKDRDKKDREKEKDKDRDKDREKDKERKKDDRNGRGRSHERSADEVSSEDEGTSFKLWPIVVATSRRTLILLAPSSELHPDVAPMEVSVSSKSRQVASEKPAMFRPAPTIALPGPHSLALPSPQSQGLGVHPAMPSMPSTPGMAGMAVPQPGFAPLGRPPSHYTGAALAQQHGKTQICFNYVGGRCFRDNCRFLHCGPGGPGGAAPPPKAFTGLMGGFS